MEYETLANNKKASTTTTFINAGIDCSQLSNSWLRTTIDVVDGRYTAVFL